MAKKNKQSASSIVPQQPSSIALVIFDPGGRHSRGSWCFVDKTMAHSTTNFSSPCSSREQAVRRAFAAGFCRVQVNGLTISRDVEELVREQQCKDQKKPGKI